MPEQLDARAIPSSSCWSGQCGERKSDNPQQEKPSFLFLSKDFTEREKGRESPAEFLCRRPFRECHKVPSSNLSDSRFHYPPDFTFSPRHRVSIHLSLAQSSTLLLLPSRHPFIPRDSLTVQVVQGIAIGRHVALRNTPPSDGSDPMRLPRWNLIWKDWFEVVNFGETILWWWTTRITNFNWLSLFCSTEE